MRKLIIAFVLLCSACSSAYSQYYFGVGYLMTRQGAENGASTASFANGISIGASRVCRIGRGWDFVPGMYFSASAGQEPYRLWDDIVLDQKSYQELSLEMPLHLAWGHSLSSSSSFFLFGGPTLQAGLVSKITNNGQSRYSDGGGLRRINAFACAGAGVTIQRISFSVGYHYGLFAPYQNRTMTSSLLHCMVSFRL